MLCRLSRQHQSNGNHHGRALQSYGHKTNIQFGTRRTPIIHKRLSHYIIPSMSDHLGQSLLPLPLSPPTHPTPNLHTLHPHHLLPNNHPTTLRAPKLLPPRRHPRDRRNRHDNPHGRRRVIHILGRDGRDGGEIARDGDENQVHEAEDVERHAPAAERVGAADGAGGGRRVAGCEGGEAGEEDEGVGDV